MINLFHAMSRELVGAFTSALERKKLENKEQRDPGQILIWMTILKLQSKSSCCLELKFTIACFEATVSCETHTDEPIFS